jgi:hypothetical protein
LTRFCSTVKEPAGRKAVGWWLAGCSGMVFVAVILGGTVIYGLILGAILIVIAEIIPKTIK